MTASPGSGARTDPTDPTTHLAAEHPVALAAPNGWYVCLTKPRQETVAVAHIEEQGYEAYLPTVRRWQRVVSGWRHRQEVLFPRYAFARPHRPGQSVSPLQSTPGVTSLVRFGPVLAVMAEDRLQALRQIVQALNAATPEQALQPGQQVVFAAGPFKGLQAIVSSVSAERVRVMLSLLGRQQVVTVESRVLAAA